MSKNQRPLLVVHYCTVQFYEHIVFQYLRSSLHIGGRALLPCQPSFLLWTLGDQIYEIPHANKRGPLPILYNTYA